jgi:hypothetical protein
MHVILHQYRDYALQCFIIVQQKKESELGDLF